MPMVEEEDSDQVENGEDCARIIADEDVDTD